MPQKKSAFEKRVKRRLIARPQQFFAVCTPGLKRLCRREMAHFNSPIDAMETIPGGIAFSGTMQCCFEANLMLRSPSRILMRVARFKAENFRTLEKKLLQIEWELYLKKGRLINVEVSTKHSRLYHTEAISERARKIITEHFNALASSEYADLDRGVDSAMDMAQTIMIRAEDDLFEISLDSSGNLLHKRGMKSNIGAAPLRETLAFAILQAVGYSGDIPLVDGMCGSGSFALEAAMIACNIPPGYYRSFAFETWPGFSSGQWRYMKKEASQRIIRHETPLIHAMDLSDEIVTSLAATIHRFNLSSTIAVKQQNFFEFHPQTIQPIPPALNRQHKTDPGKRSGEQRKERPKGIVVLNPPYGKRIENKADIEVLFKNIGKKLASDFKGWRAGIILPEKSLIRAFSAPGTLIPLFHGGLELNAAILQF